MGPQLCSCGILDLCYCPVFSLARLLQWGHNFFVMEICTQHHNKKIFQLLYNNNKKENCYTFHNKNINLWHVKYSQLGPGYTQSESKINLSETKPKPGLPTGNCWIG